MSSDLVSRAKLAGLAGQHFSGARDLYQSFGYPRTIGPREYLDVYKRQDIAGRIIDAFPNATWREPPTFDCDEVFQKSWDDLCNRVDVWSVLHRADRLAGIGHYGVILLGLDGAEDMASPARGSGYGVAYMQPHGEITADVARWDTRTNSPRFGRPHSYNITTGVNWTGAGGGQRMLTVHHSRVVHFAERSLEDVSLGIPRLEGVFNRLMDLDKLLGSGAEMYWQNAAMLIQLKADLEVQWDPEEAAALKEQIEEMQHGLRRWFRTRGVDAANIAPGLQGADPSTVIDRQLDMIAGTTAIPKRILIGSERGELSSTQDENNFDARVTERRQQHAGPNILKPFIMTGLKLGFLRGRFDGIEWPESDTLGEAARADIALKTAQAAAMYSSAPGSELLISPEEFRRTLGYDGPVPGIVEDDEI